MASPFDDTDKGVLAFLPKNEFPETALVPTHIKCSVYEHLFKMFKECSNRLCLHSHWQGRIKKSETGKSGGSHRLLTTQY